MLWYVARVWQLLRKAAEMVQPATPVIPIDEELQALVDALYA